MRVRFLAGACATVPAADPKPTRKSSYGDLSRRGAVAMAVLIALAGCASVSQKQGLAWKVEPVLDVTHGAQSSKAYYTLGRYHDGSQAWDKAIDAYRKAIAADGGNVEAYNALGVALARCNRLGDAEATLRKAVGIDPGSAHVRSNLGFVLLLSGRPYEAVGELKAALALDGQNVTAQANLHEALAQAKSGPDQAHQQSDVTAASSNSMAPSVKGTASALPASAAAAEVSNAVNSSFIPAPTPLVAPVRPVQAELQVDDRPTVPAFMTGVVAGSIGSQVNFDTSVLAVPAAPQSVPHAVLATESIRLELSNGNGIKGAAARLKQWLTTEGLIVERLTNRRPYDQQHTVIHYRTGQRDAALRVAQALRMTARLDAAPVEDMRSDVRVVLGRDWVRTAACLERKACDLPSMVTAALRH